MLQLGLFVYISNETAGDSIYNQIHYENICEFENLFEVW